MPAAPLVLRRILGPARALIAGEWTFETASGRPAVCCPDCGEIYDLHPEYVPTTPAGNVPRWPCPTESCAFQHELRLEGFGEEVIPR